MTNMEMEKTHVIGWINAMELEEWYHFSTMLDSIEDLSNRIFNCERCREEYGDCNHVDHEGILCEERFKEHSMREV